MSSQPIIISVQAAQIQTVNTIEAEVTIDRLMSDLLTAENLQRLLSK